jgi:DNA primase
LLFEKLLLCRFVSDYTQEDFSSFFSMEIQEIKNNLTLSQVLKHYGLKPDKNLRLRCPFHNDRTPSLQVYYKTHTCYCFSTNCRTHGRAMDVIDFILHKEGCTKHEAILKAKAMVEGTAVETSQNGSGNPDREKETERTALLEQVFTYFKNGVHNSKPAKEYLAGRCLDYTKTEVGYNSGQFHHGKRKDEGLIRACVEQGILLGLGTKSRTGNPAYKPFGKWCVVFPLRDEGYRITGLYFRSTLEKKKNQRHFYLKNRQGLYPHYPKQGDAQANPDGKYHRRSQPAGASRKSRASTGYWPCTARTA